MQQSNQINAAQCTRVFLYLKTQQISTPHSHRLYRSLSSSPEPLFPQLQTITLLLHHTLVDGIIFCYPFSGTHAKSCHSLMVKNCPQSLDSHLPYNQTNQEHVLSPSTHKPFLPDSPLTARMSSVGTKNNISQLGRFMEPKLCLFAFFISPTDT